MQQQRDRKSKEALRDEEDLGGQRRIDNEIAIGHARKHLGTGKGAVHRKANEIHRRLTKGRGGSDPGHNGSGPEQDEAAQYDGRAKPPVHPTRQHHQTDRCHSHNGDGGRDTAQQGALNPIERSNDRARPLRIGGDLCVGRQGKGRNGRNKP